MNCVATWAPSGYFVLRMFSLLIAYATALRMSGLSSGAIDELKPM